MKKIISLIIAVTLLCSFIPTFAYPTDITESNYKEDIKDLVSLGVMVGDSDGNFNPKNIVTRAEFSKILVTLQGLDIESLTSDKIYFKDVTKDHWAFNAINYIAGLGYIKGYDDLTFKPDNPIKYNEAIKILITFLGYKYKADLKGGYPTGYLYEAKSLDLTKGINIDNNENLYRDEVAKLINNALDIPLVINNSVGDNEGYVIDNNKNILTEYLKAGRIKAQVTANEFYGITGEVASDDCILIDGENFSVSEESDMNLVGKKVSVLYKDDEALPYKKILRAREEKNTELIIDSDKNIKITGRELTYEENEEVKKLTLSPYLKTVYNGEAVDFNESFINSLKEGNVRLLSTDNTKNYDLIFINSYKSFVVSKINNDNKIVSNYNNSAKIDFSQDKKYIIKDKDNNKIGFSDIKKDDIITYFENTGFLEIYVTDKFVTGKIISKGVEDNKNYLELEKEKIFLNDDVSVSSYVPGDTVTIYLDYFNKGNLITKKEVTKNNLKYLYKLKEKEDPANGKTLYGKFYDINNGIEEFEFENKVAVNGRTVKEFSEAKLKSFTTVPEVLEVKLNENNKISEITTPKSYFDLMKSAGDDGFCKIMDFNPDKKLIYLKDSTSFGDKIVGTRETTVLQIPYDLDTASDKDFKTMKLSTIANDTSFQVAAYAKTKDFVVPDFIMLKRDKVTAGEVPYDAPLGVITKKVRTLDSDGTEVLKYNALYRNEEKTFYVYDDDEIIDKIPSDISINAKDLKVGDFVQFLADGNDKLLNFNFWFSFEKGYKPRRTFKRPQDQLFFIISTPKKIAEDLISFTDPNGIDPYDCFTMKAWDKNLVTVKNNNGKIIIKEGTLDDLNIDDKVILMGSYSILRQIFILK